MPSAASVAGGPCECVEGPCTCEGDAEARAAVPEERASGADPEAWVRQTFPELRPPLSAALARAEAERCLECGGPQAAAPCVVSCPAEIDVPGFIAAIARDDADRAAELIFAENLLGGTCARVCPVEELCEGACVLLTEGRRPVEIARLQRFATDRALGSNRVFRRPRASTARRVAVIGAGPAGLACAGELAALGYQVAVYDERDEPGGLVRFAIAPYRQVRDPLPAEVKQLSALGVELQLGSPIDSPATLRRLEAGTDAIFLGIGMGADVAPAIPGADLAGVWESLQFIEELKRGRPPRLGRHLAVIGGGNTAIDVAREAVALGVCDVTLLYRRSEAEMPAYRHEVDEAREEGVRFSWLTQPIRFIGRDHLQAIECRRLRLGPPDASGRPRPEPVDGSEFLLPVDTAVLAIGQRPRAEFLDWIDGIEQDHGRIRVDPETGRTGNPKYFAGGDAVTGGATVVAAVRGGKRAAAGIDAALKGEVA